MRPSFLFLLSASLLVAACGDNQRTPPTAIVGSVSGLHGSGLVLANAGEVVAIGADGSFKFATPIPLGGAYDVTILAQPTAPSQACTLAGASGTFELDAPIDIRITCKTNTYTVAGTVMGLHGTGAVLQNNGADDMAVTADGTFTFAKPIMSGAGYAVTIKTQPTLPSQICAVSGGDGTMGGGNLTTVLVNCTTDAFAIGGTISGLAGTVVLHDGTRSVTITSNGTFAFPTTVASGTHYNVSVFAQPSTPSQACVVTHGIGDVTTAAIASIVVACTTNTFAIGGTVSGLLGDGLVLQDNAGNDLAVSVDGTFAFTSHIASGTTFDVTVLTQPSDPPQTCTITGGSGAVGGIDVHTVVVNCTIDQYAVGGTIGGLVGSVVLQNNAGDDITVSGNGQFAFPTTLDSGAAYAVTVLTQPSSPVTQNCVVTNDSGSIVDIAITTVTITCTTTEYAIRGNLTGLGAGDTIVLQDNGGDDLTLTGDGAFVFPTTVASGGTYAVTLIASPTSPIAQTCTVTNDSGPVVDTDILDVTVTCTTLPFTIGGSVAGLVNGARIPGGPGVFLVLQDNAGDDLTVSVNGAFTFVTPLASGSAYAITVVTQPTGLTCSVTNDTGTVGATNVTSVVVNCSPGITRWSDGSMQWPDEACNPTNSFGMCNTNAQPHADAWATFVCQNNGYSSGTWTGNKAPGCNGAVSMYCQGSIPCSPDYEYTCVPGDQTKVEITCIP